MSLSISTHTWGFDPTRGGTFTPYGAPDTSLPCGYGPNRNRVAANAYL